MSDNPVFTAGFMSGQTAFITGATSGIGAALAYAEAGAKVIAAGRIPIANTPPVTRISSCSTRRDRDEYQLNQFDKVLSVNLRAAMVANETARPMLTNNGGSIINLAFMFSTFGSKDRPAYAASKGGIVQLTHSLAEEYANEGVRVNAIAPGWIDTPLGEGLKADKVASTRIPGRTPIERWGLPAEVASVALFLSSPAAGFITGVILPVDGGYLCNGA